MFQFPSCCYQIQPRTDKLDDGQRHVKAAETDGGNEQSHQRRTESDAQVHEGEEGGSAHSHPILGREHDGYGLGTRHVGAESQAHAGRNEQKLPSGGRDAEQ